MKLEPTAKDFFVNVEKVYGNEIITPCEGIEKFLESLSFIYPLERVPLSDVLPELKNYLTGRNLGNHEYEAYKVLEDERTRLFFDFNKQRNVFQNSIYLLVNRNSEEFISETKTATSAQRTY